MLSEAALNDEYMRLSRMATDRSVTDEEMGRAIERFEALDAPPERKALALQLLGTTMEWRDPGHLAEQR